MDSFGAILALSLSREQWLGIIAVVGVAGIILALLGVLQWMRIHCTMCNKPWERTGNMRDGGHMAGRRAVSEEWKCPSCGHVE
jgi:hypothetical protein